MPTLYNAKAPRRAVNLSLNADLVAKARAERLNLSSIAKDAIGRALAQAAALRFEHAISLSVAEHTAYLDQYCSLADAVRAMSRNEDAGG
jgi:antitoxin CcdA